MSYIGLQPVTQTLSTATQYFNGDGVTLQFILQQGVGKGSDIIVAVGNTLQIPNTDYTATGTNLIFNAGKAPASGTNNVSVTFISGSLQTLYVTANAYPTGNSVSPAIYSVAATSTGIWWPSTTSLAFSASGNTRVTVSDAASGVATSTSTGALRIAGGMGVTGAVYGNSLVLVGGAPSTSTASGALQVTGGAGITGALNVGGTVTVSGGLTVAGAFNTTATNSLTVNTPFIFVANTNVGDAVDQGVVGTYNDGVQRYTGIYRSQSDGRWKLFANLTNPPSTLVDSANVSYRYADLWVGNANITAITTSTTATTGALTVWGGIGARGSMYLNSLNNSVAIGNGGTNGTGDIGASGATFGQIWGTNGNFTGYVNATGNVIAAVVTASQLNTTGNLLAQAGTLNALTVNGTTTLAGTVTVSSGFINSVGNVLATGAVLNALTINGQTNTQSVVPLTTNTYSIGSTTNWYSRTWALATNAAYADLAEKYQADADYAPGTVVEFGGEQEITLATLETSRVAGVVSTEPAYLMNGKLATENSVAIALTGRVPCKVIGTVRKGDLMTSAGNGYAHANPEPRVGTVIGKALENFDGSEGVIEVVVGRL